MHYNKITEIELLIWMIETRSRDLLTDDVIGEVADLLDVFRYRSTLFLALESAAVHFKNDSAALLVINAFRGAMKHENQ